MTLSLDPTSSSPPRSNQQRPAVDAWVTQGNVGKFAWWLCLILLLLVCADQVRRAATFRVDDAYITFSFSKNLAAGHGPVFSHGLRVEGYSNFLWMVVIALRYVFSADPDPYGYARAVALIALVACAFAVYRLTRRAAGPAAALVSLGLLASCSDLFRAAASGLETAAFAAAIVIGWAVYLSEPAERRRWSLLAFVPASLLRIDGFVPMLVVFGVELLSLLFAGRFSLFKLVRWAAPAFLIWGAYFAWRYAYYGLPLPTTYYAKSVVSVNDPDRGARQAWDWLRDYGGLPLLPLLFLPLIRGARREAACLAVAVLLQVFYAISVGGDWMPFNRFFLPVVPLVAVLAGWGSEQFWRTFAHSRIMVRWSAHLLLLAGLAFVAVHMHVASIDSPQEAEKLGNATHVASHTKDNLLAVKDLMAYVVRQPGDRLVTDYAGVFSVFTDAEVIDMWGLCNEDIALHGGTNGINPIYGKECAECYGRLDPDYFHVNVPMARAEDSFHDFSGVLANIFQGPAIDRAISLSSKFAVGRVVEESTGRTLWFLERRRSERSLVLRRPAPGFHVDYPFAT